MKVLNANINSIVLDYFKNNLKHFSCIQDANKLIKESFGIISFFHNEEDLSQLKKNIPLKESYLSELDRTEYGDFQTNIEL